MNTYIAYIHKYIHIHVYIHAQCDDDNDRHQWMAKPDLTHSLHKAGYAVTFDKFQFITINGAGIIPYYVLYGIDDDDDDIDDDDDDDDDDDGIDRYNK